MEHEEIEERLKNFSKKKLLDIAVYCTRAVTKVGDFPNWDEWERSYSLGGTIDKKLSSREGYEYSNIAFGERYAYLLEAISRTLLCASCNSFEGTLEQASWALSEAQAGAKDDPNSAVKELDLKSIIEAFEKNPSVV